MGDARRIAPERCIVRVVAGGARGADTIAAEWAKARSLPCDVFMANWAELGRKAGPIRNQQMLGEGRPNLVVAFPGGRGTEDMIRRARSAGVEVIECRRDLILVASVCPVMILATCICTPAVGMKRAGASPAARTFSWDARVALYGIAARASFHRLPFALVRFRASITASLRQ